MQHEIEYHIFFKHPIIEEKSVLSSSTGVVVTEKIIKKKENYFPTYNPRKRVCNEEHNTDTDILTSNVAEIINKPQILVKSSPDTVESEIYSMKHMNKKNVLQNVKHDFDFRSKTANYINQVIPMEKDLVKKYDNARMKVKPCPNDKLLHDEFSILSAQIEIKLLIKNDELKNIIKSTEMKQIMESASFNPFQCDETEQKQYDEIIFKLKIIRVLRTELNF